MARNIFQPTDTTNEGLFAFLEEGTTIPDTAVPAGGVTVLRIPVEAAGSSEGDERNFGSSFGIRNLPEVEVEARKPVEGGSPVNIRESSEAEAEAGSGSGSQPEAGVEARPPVRNPEPSGSGSTFDTGSSRLEAVSEVRKVEVSPSDEGAGNFRPGVEVLVPSSPKKRAEANFAALRVLETLRAEGRKATVAEQGQLAQWSSWGALPQVFEKHRAEWADEHAAIATLLSAAEISAASATTLNAHYTDPAIVAAMWGALTDMGVGSGSTVLEPGSGSGTFIGLAPEGVNMVGIELDPVTAAISSALYPNAHIRSEGFQKTVFPAGAVNAVVGNVPFGGFALHDPQFNGKRLNIHNHFISKSLQLVAPAGIVMVISSSFTMDSKGRAARDEFAKHGDFLGAVRLPNGAFRRVSGTDVMTDVLVFRRHAEDRVEGDAKTVGVPFQNVVEISPTLRGATVEADASATVNEYFVARPENVLGEFHLDTGMYNGATLGVKGDTNAAALAVQVRSRLDVILEPYKGAIALQPSAELVVDVFPPGLQVQHTQDARPGTVRATLGNKVERFSLDGVWKAVTPTGSVTAAEMVALIAIKDTARTLITSQRTGEEAGARGVLRVTLGSQYDAYVEKFGAVNRFVEVPAAKPTKAAIEKSMRASRAIWLSELPDDMPALERKNIEPDEALFEQWQKEAEETDGIRRTQAHLSIFRGDPDLGLMLALEHFDEETQQARKSRMFVEDVIGARPKVGSAGSVQDAIAISLDESRSIDVARIAVLLGVEEVAAREQMRGLVFTDPTTGEIVPAALYLSGDVRAKLATALDAADADAAFIENATALAVVVPEWLGLDEINVRPGVRWLPTEMYVKFCEEVFKASPEVMGEDPTTGAWEVKGPPKSKFDPSVAFSFGTNDRSPIELFASVMNNRSITIKRTVTDPITGADTQKEDVKATIEAREKATQIVAAFTGWLGQDEARQQRVEADYNRLFNSHVRSDWSEYSSAMTLPGLADGITPHPYQRAAVSQIVNSPTVLLDHVVGAGKTGTMVMAAMELRRTGVAQRPWIVVPNHLVEQVAREFTEWYPAASVLPIPSGGSERERNEALAYATANDWDAVVVPYSVFSKIGISSERSAGWLDEEITGLRQALEVTDPSNKSRVKKVEKAIKEREKRFEQITEGKDSGLTFEETGCDYLFVDEAHSFKNLHRLSDFNELAHTGSQRATDLDWKLRALRESKTELAENAGADMTNFMPAVATFATGTAVANSLAEAWVTQHYLRPDVLDRLGLKTVDAWAVQFTRAETRMKVNPSGSGYKAVNMLAKFVNVPELLRISDNFTSIVGIDDITAKLPQVVGGTRRAITREPSELVQAVVADLVERANSLPSDPSIDNLLKIVHEGRMLALDPQTLGYPADDDGGRPLSVASEAFRIWDANKNKEFHDELGDVSPVRGALQIAFCDRSTPKYDGEFNMYDAIAEELVGLGMPREQIAFIHDAADGAARDRLFARCRNGEVSLLIGSTEKMGTGTNVQRRLAGIHHVDIPWKPADIEQREGRGIRQGNENDDIELLAYVTSKTLDVFMWDNNARKAGFIAQIKGRKYDARVLDNATDDMAISAAMITAIATGDPRVMELAELRNEALTLGSLERSHFDAQRALRSSVDRLNTRHAFLVDQIEVVGKAKGTLTIPATFVMTVEGNPATADRTVAGAQLLKSLEAAFKDRDQVPREQLGTYAGQNVTVTFDKLNAVLTLGACTSVIPFTAIVKKELGEVGLIRRIENLPPRHEQVEAEYRTELAALPALLASTSENVGIPFARAEELAVVASKIVVLEGALADSDDAENVENHDAPSTVPMELLRQLLHTDSKGNVIVRRADMQVGDTVSGVGKAGLWEVAQGERREVFIPQGKTLRTNTGVDTGVDQLSIEYNKDYQLISRPLKYATELERAAMALSDRDDIVRGVSNVEVGQRIRAFGKFFETGSEIEKYNKKLENITGIVIEGETSRNEQAIRLEDGREGTFSTETYQSPIIRYGVRDPEKELELMTAEADKKAARNAVTDLQELLPGDVVLEDIPEIGVSRGDVVAAAASFGAKAFRCPDTGAYRTGQSYKYTPRALSWMPGRELHAKEMGKLFPEDAAQTAATLRVGDRVISTDLNKKATLTNEVVITQTDGGSMVGFSYRDANDPKATAEACRRKEDQSVTLLGRRYGALTDMELLHLAVPEAEFANVELSDPALIGKVVGFTTRSRNHRNELVVGTLLSATAQTLGDARYGNERVETTLTVRVVDETQTLTMQGSHRDLAQLPEGMLWAPINYSGTPLPSESPEELDRVDLVEEPDEALHELLREFASEVNAETMAVMQVKPEALQPGSPEWDEFARQTGETLDRRAGNAERVSVVDEPSPESPLEAHGAGRVEAQQVKAVAKATAATGPTAAQIGLTASILSADGERFTVVGKQVKGEEVFLDLRSTKTNEVKNWAFDKTFNFQLAPEEGEIGSDDWHPEPPTIGLN